MPCVCVIHIRSPPILARGWAVFFVDYNLTTLHSHAQMNVEQSLREIIRRTPAPPRRRAGHGQWTDPARLVCGLVDKGWSVSDGVREVIEAHKLHPPDAAFKGIRAAYYVIRNAEKAATDDFEV